MNFNGDAETSTKRLRLGTDVPLSPHEKSLVDALIVHNGSGICLMCNQQMSMETQVRWAHLQVCMGDAMRVHVSNYARRQ